MPTRPPSGIISVNKIPLPSLSTDYQVQARELAAERKKADSGLCSPMCPCRVSWQWHASEASSFQGSWSPHLIYMGVGVAQDTVPQMYQPKPQDGHNAGGDPAITTHWPAMSTGTHTSVVGHTLLWQATHTSQLLLEVRRVGMRN